MSIAAFKKDPVAVLDFAFDWSSLLSSGDAIVSASATASDGITIDADGVSGAVHTVWLSGGTHGRSYYVWSEVTTSGGRTDRRSVTISVKNE